MFICEGKKRHPPKKNKYRAPLFNKAKYLFFFTGTNVYIWSYTQEWHIFSLISLYFSSSDPKFGQLSADLTNNGVKFTQLWVRYSASSWPISGSSLTRNGVWPHIGPFRVEFDQEFLECVCVFDQLLLEYCCKWEWNVILISLRKNITTILLNNLKVKLCSCHLTDNSYGESALDYLWPWSKYNFTPRN